MIKVVQLVPRDGIGGVESAARSMLGDSSLLSEFNLVFIQGTRSVQKHDGGSRPSAQSENNPSTHLRALQKINSIKPDVLICSLWRSVPVGLVVKLMRPRTKLVFFLHYPTTTHLLDRLFSSLMVSCCDAVWADSAATISSRVGSKKTLVKRVISFVTSGNPEGMTQTEYAPRFVFWGRLHHQKGLDRAIRFMKMLTERGCDGSYEIWGPDGGELKSLVAQIERADLKNIVTIMGPANPDELTRIAQDNCFYLQLSRNEGMAMSVVEAMQRSLVPVVTAVGEIGTYCRQGQNAIVVNDPDNPVAAVSDVISVLNDESTYRGLQSAAHDYWAQHTLYRDDICAAANELCNPD